MNNKKLATAVFKHPLIQEILKQKLAESSIVNRLIVEEIMVEDELGEGAATPKGNIAAKVRNYITRALAANRKPEEIIKLISPESKQYKRWLTSAIKALGEEEEGLKVLNNAVEAQLNSLGDSQSPVKTGLPPAEDEQIASFIKSINNDPKSYQRILGNVKKNPDFDLSDEQKEILKQTFDKTHPPSASPKEPDTDSTGKDEAPYTDEDYSAFDQWQQKLIEAGVTEIKKIGMKAFMNKYFSSDEKGSVDAKLEMVSQLPLELPQNNPYFDHEMRDPEFANPLIYLMHAAATSEESNPYGFHPELFLDGNAEMRENFVKKMTEDCDTEEHPQYCKALEWFKNEYNRKEPEAEIDPESPSPIETSEVDEETVTKDFTDNKIVQQQEIDESKIQSMDEFFGQTPNTASFMGQLFLQTQASMLYGLIDNLNEIIRGPADEDGSTQRRAFNEEKEEETETNYIPWSKKDKITLKREVGDFADLLKDARGIADAYQRFGFRQSASAGYDGTSLERMLTGTGQGGDYGVLGQVQEQCGLLIAFLAKIIAEQGSELEPLQEQQGSREEKVKFIREIYNKMGSIYVNSLKPSLTLEETNEAEEAEPEVAEPEVKQISRDVQRKAIAAAEEMKDLAKEIIKFFPQSYINSQGEVVTLATAIKELDKQIGLFGQVLRDLYMTVKDDGISSSNIKRLALRMRSLSKAIEDSFGVPMRVPRKADKTLLDPSDESLSDEEGPQPSVDSDADSPDFPDVAEIARRFAEEGPSDEESEESMIDRIMKKVREETPEENLPETEEELEVVVKDEVEKYVSPLFKSEHWENLEEEYRDAIKNFITLYNKETSPVLESVSPYARRKKKQKQIVDNFPKRLHLRGPTGKKKMQQIMKNMKDNHRVAFLALVREEHPVINLLVNHLTQSSEDEEEVTSRAASRSRSRINKRMGRREQIIRKLKPIIEQLLKEM